MSSFVHVRELASHVFARSRSMTRFAGTCLALASVWTLIAHELISYGNSEGPSMYPTIPSELSTNVTSQRHKLGKGVQVGDIVVFRSPIFPGSRSCKRIIGMPGDYVVRDAHLSPTVGGAPIPGLNGNNTDTTREEPVMVQVPEGHVWVAGDNLWSRDSRFHGPVPMALIQGKTIYIGRSWVSWASFREPQLQAATVSPEIPYSNPQDTSHAGPQSS